MKISIINRVIFVFILFMGFVSSRSGFLAEDKVPPSFYDDYILAVQAAAKGLNDSLRHPDFERFLSWLPTVETLSSGQPFYVVEGDYLMSREEVQDYVLGLVADESVSAVPTNGELITDEINGQLNIFSETERTITFWIDPVRLSDPKLAEIVQWAEKSANQWNDLCTECVVNFVLKKECRSSHCGRKLDFVIRFYREEYYMLAMFPNKIKDWRKLGTGIQPQLKVGKKMFEPNLPALPEHIIRHEFGHVLGYRHENIHTKRHNIPDQCFSASSRKQWREVASFDPRSVMYTFCDESVVVDFSPTDIKVHSETYALRIP